MIGHQGSYAILKSLYPGEVIFNHTLYDLYLCMDKELHQLSMTSNEEYLAKTMRSVATSIYENWIIEPLLPLSLMDNEDWLPPAPFTPGNIFFWTFLVVVGRLEQLKQELPAMRFAFESDGFETATVYDFMFQL